MALNMAWKILFIVFFFGFCIFIHEFGHFIFAKANKIKIMEKEKKNNEIRERNRLR